MRRLSSTSLPLRCAALTLAMLAAPDAALPETRPAATVAADFDAEIVFETLKQGLVGEWRGTLEPGAKPVEVTFYLTGNDSALVEDIRRLDKDSRMHTVYHLADGDLRLTHFCSFRNQPRLRATSVSADGKSVEFELVDVTNLTRSGNRYTHRMIVSLIDEDRATVTYVGLEDGVEGSLSAALTRVSQPPRRGSKSETSSPRQGSSHRRSHRP